MHKMPSTRLQSYLIHALAGLGYVCALVAPPNAQTPLGLFSSDGKVISPELYDTISTILINNTVPGYSLAIVRPGADTKVEYGTWGNRTEDGDEVTPNVRAPYLFHVAVIAETRQ